MSDEETQEAPTAETSDEAGAEAAAPAAAETPGLGVRREIIETLTPAELEYFHNIRNYLSTLKQPERERWIIAEMQKLRIEKELEEATSIVLPPPKSGDEEEDLEGEGMEERTSGQSGGEQEAGEEGGETEAAVEAAEVEEEMTEEERAFQAFLADEAKKCLICKRYCHKEENADYLYLPCSVCEIRACHMCKRFCYKCARLICINCLLVKQKTGRKYCHDCFQESKLNERELKCEVCYIKTDMEERVISCWRCFSLACMKTCARYTLDGYMCRRCLQDLKEQEEARKREAEGIEAGTNFDGNVNADILNLGANRMESIQDLDRTSLNLKRFNSKISKNSFISKTSKMV